MRDICDILGVNRSSFYYQPREAPSEEVLRAEIEQLAGAYPRYGYRRITQLLVRQGYTVGTRRVARLMKDCTAPGNSGHSLNQDCGRIQSNLKGASDGETKTKKLHARV